MIFAVNATSCSAFIDSELDNFYSESERKQAHAACMGKMTAMPADFNQIFRKKQRLHLLIQIQFRPFFAGPPNIRAYPQITGFTNGCL